MPTQERSPFTGQLSGNPEPQLNVKGHEGKGGWGGKCGLLEGRGLANECFLKIRATAGSLAVWEHK